MNAWFIVGAAHADSSFIFAHVLSGEIESKVNDGATETYRAGESWYEPPASTDIAGQLGDHACRSGAEFAPLLPRYMPLQKSGPADTASIHIGAQMAALASQTSLDPNAERTSI